VDSQAADYRYAPENSLAATPHSKPH